MNPNELPASLNQMADLLLILFDAAADSVQKATRAHRKKDSRLRRGVTLTPGINTPLWNQLAALAHPHLRRRGSQAHLARLLGVSRQRVHDCLESGKTCLDAERALLLLCWIAARQQGRELLA